MKKKLLLIMCMVVCSACMITSCKSDDTSGTQSSVQQVSEEDIDENTGSIVMPDSLDILYFATFDDGDTSRFAARSDDDPTTIAVTDEMVKSGKKSLCASGRTNEKNGPVLKLDGICEPNMEYSVNLTVMQRDRSPITIGLEYTDTNGDLQTKPLLTTTEGGRWHNVNQLLVSIPGDFQSGYIYFEGGTSDIFIDFINVIALPPIEVEFDIDSLSQVFEDDFRIGTAITPTDLESRNVTALLEKHFDKSITVGNELKPDYVLDQDASLEYFQLNGDDEHPQISFEKAKPVLDYAQGHNIPVRVHTLVWHSQTPTWFFKEGYDPKGDWVSPEKMNVRLENYIKAYFEKLTELYPDIDFYACDVVNEAWMEDGNPRKAGDNKVNEGESAWVQVYGDNSFIEQAFTYARKYAPEGCKLYYNDYNEYMDNKLNAIIDMALDLKGKGLIDGIGMQSHLDVRQGADAFPSVDMYNRALDNYCSLGLDIQITELDATVPNDTDDVYFEAQAEYYKGIMEAAYDHKDNISAVIFWGITDDRSWRSYGQPLLFDGDYKAKPAFYAIIEDHKN
ncbi:MAG: endo-1,4-beta-xylanase [Ruminococcus sp.]|nr:endo-1,4-beta-xylanase [Ruminococcus sp.]